MPVMATFFSVRRGRDPFFKTFMRTQFPKQVRDYEQKFGIRFLGWYNVAHGWDFDNVMLFELPDYATLDKLEAIPGFRVHLSLDEKNDAPARVGCAMIGQTAEIAPADKEPYALRDVTGTAESGPTRAGIAICDLLGGIFAVQGILLALEVRHRTGRGSPIGLDRSARHLNLATDRTFLFRHAEVTREADVPIVGDARRALPAFETGERLAQAGFVLHEAQFQAEEGAFAVEDGDEADLAAISAPGEVDAARCAAMQAEIAGSSDALTARYLG